MKLRSTFSLLTAAALLGLTPPPGAQSQSYDLSNPTRQMSANSAAWQTSLHTDAVILHDDFVGDALNGDLWGLWSGSDAEAVDPAISDPLVQFGAIQLVTGDAVTGTAAVGGSGLVSALQWQADQGRTSAGNDLMLEARVQLSTASSAASAALTVGFTDLLTAEEPFTISGTTVTSNATDAVGFVYDPGATTDQWYLCGVKDDTDATHVPTGTSLSAATWVVLRVVVSEYGDAQFYIDGVLAGGLTGAVTNTVALTPVICATNTDTDDIKVLVDYVTVIAPRN